MDKRLQEDLQRHAQQDQAKIGCVQHDCEECQKRIAQEPVEYLGALKNVDGSVNLYFKKDQWQAPIAEISEGMLFWNQPVPDFEDGTKLYTHPHQVVPTRTWNSLTDDEIWEYHNKTDSDNWVIDFARAIEQALKEKNG